MLKSLIILIISINISNYAECKVSYNSKENNATTITKINGITLKISYLKSKEILSERKNDSKLKNRDVQTINLNNKKVKLKIKKLKDLNINEYILNGNIEYYKYKFGKKVIVQKVQYKYGIKNGQLEEYYPNGKIKLIENYLNGELDGYILSYDVEGVAVEKLYYKKGKLIKKF